MVAQLLVALSVLKVILSFLVNRSCTVYYKKEKPGWQINLNFNVLLFFSLVIFVV